MPMVVWLWAVGIDSWSRFVESCCFAWSRWSLEACQTRDRLSWSTYQEATNKSLSTWMRAGMIEVYFMTLYAFGWLLCVLIHALYSFALNANTSTSAMWLVETAGMILVCHLGPITRLIAVEHNNKPCNLCQHILAIIIINMMSMHTMLKKHNCILCKLHQSLYIECFDRVFCTLVFVLRVTVVDWLSMLWVPKDKVAAPIGWALISRHRRQGHSLVKSHCDNTVLQHWPATGSNVWNDWIASDSNADLKTNKFCVVLFIHANIYEGLF